MTEHKMENNSSNSFSVAFKYELDFTLGVTMLAVVLVEEVKFIALFNFALAKNK